MTSPPRSVLWLLLALVAMPSVGLAQRPEQEPLLGERSFGLGGAVLGSSAGPTAAYYNPAGLADTPGTSAGATLSLRSYQMYRLSEGYTSVLGVQDLTDDGLLSVPVFLGAVLKFGDEDETNIRQHALAAGMLIRSSRDRELYEQAVSLEDGVASSLEIVDREETRWFYVSYAFRASNQISFGLTAAVSNYDREYRESWTQASGLLDGWTGGGGLLSARQTRVDASSTSLVLRAGASFRPSDWIQFGVVFQAPGIELFDGGTALFSRVTANSTGVGEPTGFFRVDAEDIDVHASLPWQLRVGSYARFDRLLGVAVDLGISGSDGSENEPVNPLGFEVPLDGDRPAATYLADRFWSDITFDAALGVEVQIAPEVPLRAGAWTALSGMPRAVGTREAYLPDRVDRVGFTAAIGARGERYDFGLGVGYTYGWGTGLRPVSPYAGGYATTEVQQHEVMIFLSGVTGAATQLALETYHAIVGDRIDDTAVEPDALEDVEALQPEPTEPRPLPRYLPHPSWILQAIDAPPDDEVAPEAAPFPVPEAPSEATPIEGESEPAEEPTPTDAPPPETP